MRGRDANELARYRAALALHRDDRMDEGEPFATVPLSSQRQPQSPAKTPGGHRAPPPCPAGGRYAAEQLTLGTPPPPGAPPNPKPTEPPTGTAPL